MLLLEGGFVIYGFMHALTCNDSVDLVMLPEIPVLSHTTSVMNVYCHFEVISLKKKPQLFEWLQITLQKQSIENKFWE